MRHPRRTHRNDAAEPDTVGETQRNHEVSRNRSYGVSRFSFSGFPRVGEFVVRLVVVDEQERRLHLKAAASFNWWHGFCSAPWRSCCCDHAGLAAGSCWGLNREGYARSGPFRTLSLRQSPKAPPLTRITMPRPMRTTGKRMFSKRSSTSAIGGRVATNFARATKTATSARKITQ